MIDSIYLLYVTDNWHSYDSRDLIAVCDNLQTAIELANEYLNKYNLPELTDSDLQFFEEHLQTQSYFYGDFEFDIDPISDINKLL